MAFQPLAAQEKTVGVIIDKSTRVYIREIPVSRIESEGADALKQEFAAFGPIELYQLHRDESGRYTGTGICTYRNPADAKLAIYKLNDVEIDGCVLKVSPAKEHGVILTNQLKRYTRREKSHEEERWGHDKFEAMQRGEDPFARRGRGRGGRGGRGARSDIESSFESYIAQRDRERERQSAPSQSAEASSAPASDAPQQNEEVQ